VDEEAMTVVCEPLVNMGHLTRVLLPKGLALKVQIEMEDITIGGLSMGLGMETNSHRFGLLQECVRAYDVVLADETRELGLRAAHIVLRRIGIDGRRRQQLAGPVDHRHLDAGADARIEPHGRARPSRCGEQQTNSSCQTEASRATK